MNKSICKLLIACAMSSGWLTIAGTASASGPSYAIQGNSCFPSNGDYSTVTYSPQYGIGNTSTSQSLAVNCPITGDIGPVGQFSLYLQGYNRNASSATSCTVVITDKTGSDKYQGTASLTGNVGWAGKSVIVDADGKVGPFFLQCQIAPRTSSGNSYVTEVIFQS
jgi:hypothetical protein